MTCDLIDFHFALGQSLHPSKLLEPQSRKESIIKLRIFFNSQLNGDAILRRFTSLKSGNSIWASGEHGLGVSINNGGPNGYASSGENPCNSCFFMLDNSSWKTRKKSCYLHLNTTRLFLCKQLHNNFCLVFQILHTPNIIFASKPNA